MMPERDWNSTSTGISETVQNKERVETMIILVVLISLTPGDMAGFWHSEQDLDDGYGSCYFFWESGEYAYLSSIDEGTIYMGDWYMTSKQLVLNMWDAILLDGTAVNIRFTEIPLRYIVPEGTEDLILLDGESFFRLDTDPDAAILALMPTWGMSESERDAFSTYD
jgi:hypothetical protein